MAESKVCVTGNLVELKCDNVVQDTGKRGQTLSMTCGSRKIKVRVDDDGDVWYSIDGDDSKTTSLANDSDGLCADVSSK